MKHNENRRKGAKNGPSGRGRPAGGGGEGSDLGHANPGSGSLSGDNLLAAGSGELELSRPPKAARGCKRPRTAEVRPYMKQLCFPQKAAERLWYRAVTASPHLPAERPFGAVAAAQARARPPAPMCG